MLASLADELQHKQKQQAADMQELSAVNAYRLNAQRLRENYQGKFIMFMLPRHIVLTVVLVALKELIPEFRPVEDAEADEDVQREDLTGTCFFQSIFYWTQRLLEPKTRPERSLSSEPVASTSTSATLKRARDEDDSEDDVEIIGYTQSASADDSDSEVEIVSYTPPRVSATVQRGPKRARL